MKKLNVLQINKIYYPFTGGIEAVVQQIAEGLKDEVDMKVLVCNDNKKTKVEMVNGVEVYRMGSFAMVGNMPLSLSFIGQLKKMSKEADVLHFHMPFPVGDVAGLLSGYKGKIVVWWHSDVVRQKKMMILYRPIMEQFLKRADTIIVATQGHIDGSSYLKPYQDKCVIVPFGINPEIQQKADLWVSRKQASVQTEPAIENNGNKKTRFLFVGRLVYYKGCSILLDALTKVENAELVMVGSGVLEQELKEQARANGIADRVEFLGNVDNEALEEEFAKCDVFVLPSIVKSEAFGLVQIEAMAYEKPVINTNLPSGVPYVSLHGETGLTVEPESVQELADAMNWMTEHKEERIEMGRKGRIRVLKEFQMDQMLDGVMKIYQS